MLSQRCPLRLQLQWPAELGLHHHCLGARLEVAWRKIKVIRDWRG